MVLWGIATPAFAIDPWGLPIGVHNDIQACLEDDDSACQDAAARVGDPAWAAWLGGDSAGALSADQLQIYRGLQCADGDGAACRQLGLSLLEADSGSERVRGATLLVRACGLGDSPGCALSGAAGDGRAAAEMSLYTDVWGRWKDSGVPSAKDLLAAGKACAKGDAPARACLETVQLVSRNLGSDGAMMAAAASAREACSKDPGGAACAMAEDSEDRSQAVLRRLDGSRALLQQICVGHYVGRACAMAASMLEMGGTRPFGTMSSRELHKASCDAGSDTSCQALTATYRSPLGPVTQSRCESVAAGGSADARACTEYATMLTFGVGIDKDEDKAARMQRVACEHGDGFACDDLADDLWETDRLASYSWYQRACDAGVADACEVTGRMELHGEDGVAKNVAAGLADLRKGCDGHSHYACSALGYAYYGNEDVTLDPATAWRASLQACSLGSLSGCTTVAWLKLDGVGTQRDTAGAVLLASWACQQGNVSACLSLGELYHEGGDVPVDLARSNWAYGEACRQAGEVAPADDTGGAVDDEACARYDATAPETPIASEPLPQLSATSSWSEPSAPGGSEVVPGPVRPRPGPSYSESPSIALGLSLGTQRSWTAESQASVLRLSLDVPLVRVLGVGADLDWVSDNRWRPKVARSYWRMTGFINLKLAIPIPGIAYLDLGAGPGLGGYREGPGKTGTLGFSYGAHEYLQIGVRSDKFMAGIRIEQQQLWVSGDPAIDHVTGLYGVVGGSFD